MKTIVSKTVIHAPVDVVWNVLTDFEAYPKWNPFIRKIDGKLEESASLTIELLQKNGKTLKFNPQLLKVDPKKELRWKGKLWVNGIFDGEHYFLLETFDAYKTIFIHGEIFSGVLTYFLAKMIEETKDSFNQMNLELKNYCESKLSTK